MRALHPLQAIVAAAVLSVACDSTTGPEISPPDPGPTVLTVAPRLATIEGQSFVKLTAILSGEAALVPQSEVTWSSSDSAVATVRSGGLVEGRKAGRVQISATYGAAYGSATVIVLSQVAKKPTHPPCLKRRAPLQRDLIFPHGGGKC
jgi:hypothetical protein